MHYYIETFLPRDNFFDILLVFFFLQTNYGMYSSHNLSFCFFLLQISFCIYLLLAVLIFFYHFHNNILLYLVSLLGFFDNRLNQHSRVFLCIIKNVIKYPFYESSQNHYVNCIIFAPIPKINSVSTSLNINNSNIIKTHSFFH